MKNGKEDVVREIMMGSPVTLKPEDTLDLANDVISLGRIRHIPVVEDGRLIGLLSERDLMGAAATTMPTAITPRAIPVPTLKCSPATTAITADLRSRSISGTAPRRSVRVSAPGKPLVPP